jgi:TonB family protein
MKTKKAFRFNQIIRVSVTLLFFVFAVIAFSSCGKNKSQDAIPSGLTPPPPPPVPVADSAYVYVDEMPVFTGGDQAILNYIGKNTVYPEDAKKKGIQGKVIVKFVVLKDGTADRFEILKSVDPSLDAEAIRVVKSLPKFEKPAILKGEPVAVYFMVPISFQLN